jgi:hypothetical protein
VLNKMQMPQQVLHPLRHMFKQDQISHLLLSVRWILSQVSHLTEIHVGYLRQSA